MTALELYEATLVELNKVNSPTFTVPQFNYFLNKAILHFVNEKYSLYALNQQLSDDLRVLLSEYKAVLSGTTITIDSGETVLGAAQGTTTEYLNNVQVSDISKFRKGDVFKFSNDSPTVSSSERTITSIDLTESSFRFTPQVPFLVESEDPERTVWYTNTILQDAKIHFIDTNLKKDSSLSEDAIYTFTIYVNNYLHLLSARSYWKGINKKTGQVICDTTTGETQYRMYPVKRLTYDMLTNIETNAYLTPAYRRPYYMMEDNPLNTGTEKNEPNVSRYYQNRPLIHIHTGKPEVGIELEEVLINYLKLPELVLLSNEEVYTNITDTSQILEFPDSIKNDLVKILVKYFLENVSNPRVQTFEAFNTETRLPQQAAAQG